MQARSIQYTLTLLVTLTLASWARAGSVQVEVSSREVYQGVPFRLVVTISDTEDYETPRWPEIDGLVFAGPPSRSSQSVTNIVGGRVTQKTTVGLTWEITATRPGRLTIPAIDVDVDGAALRTRPIVVTAVKPSGGDLLIAEIVPGKLRVYLGEPLELTLRLWIKPFRDPALMEGPLSSETMWSLIDLNRSTWGDFIDPLRDMLGGRIGLGMRGRNLTGKPVRRESDDGLMVTYFQYELGVTLWPTQDGNAPIAPVTVIINYPTRLARSRSVFSRGEFQLADSKLVVAPAAAPAVPVLAPPEAGRPDSYTGAVGRFDIAAGARPNNVAVGDPITLSVRITDRSPAGIRLEHLQPPRLDGVPELVEGFKVSSDPITGVVQGRAKTFTDTIRARDERVSRIPSIPFAYFDPDLERYVIARSDPIAIHVDPGTALSMSDVVGGAEVLDAGPTELTEVQGGLLANETDARALLASRPAAAGWWHLGLVAAPPLVFAFVGAGRRRARRLREDHAWGRRRGARRNALKRIGAATGAGDGEAARRADAVAAALRDYVADRLGAPAGALTRAEVGARLRAGGADDGLRAEVDDVLGECEALRYAGATSDGSGAIDERARRCIDRLERERFGMSDRRLLIPFLLLLAVAAIAPRSAASALTTAQRETILVEAQTAYDRGVRELRRDRVASRAAFAEAARRYGQLADDGIVSGPLHYNLANAYLQAGDLGRAIVHYRTAERLIPSSPGLRHNLAYARSLRRSQIAPSGGRALAGALLSWHHGFSFQRRFTLFGGAWLVFWIALFIRLFRPAPIWRWTTLIAAALWIAFGASVASDLLLDDREREGVVIVDDVIVRKGNGEGFEPQFEEPLHQGVEFTVLDRRPGWLQIELPNEKTGWIREEHTGLIG